MSGRRPDPLFDLYVKLRDALAPLGVRVNTGVLELWRDSYARGQGLFTGSGELQPHVAARLLAFAAEIEANTADEPTGEQQDG